MTAPRTFPDDENGDVLRRMQASGDDLSKPRDIDFAVALPAQEMAERLARAMREQGHVVTIERTACVPALPWDVCVTRHMLPTHAGITAFEDELAVIAAPLGGRNDGWGCFEQ